MPIIPTGYDEIRGRAQTLAVILLIGAIGGILYWVAFFTSGAVQATDHPCYLVFERAFPAADAWTAFAAIVAGTALWRRRAHAVLFGIAAGSGFVFLGLMDVLYNLEHGMYAVRTPEMASETLINVVCLTLGPVAMAYCWLRRRVLDPR